MLLPTPSTGVPVAVEGHGEVGPGGVARPRSVTGPGRASPRPACAGPRRPRRRPPRAGPRPHGAAATAYAWVSTSAIGGGATVPSRRRIASPESFQPWLARPVRSRRRSAGTRRAVGRGSASPSPAPRPGAGAAPAPPRRRGPSARRRAAARPRAGWRRPSRSRPVAGRSSGSAMVEPRISWGIFRAPLGARVVDLALSAGEGPQRPAREVVPKGRVSRRGPDRSRGRTA